MSEWTATTGQDETGQDRTGRRTGLFITETRYRLPGNVMIQVALGSYVSPFMARS